MKFISTNKNYLFLLVLIVILIPYLLLSAYCSPIADDFTYSLRGKENPLFATLQHDFFHWNGRYFSNILVLHNPLVFDSLTGYKLIPVVLILLTLLSFHLFVYALSHEYLKKIEILTISLLLTVLFLYQMPLISEGIYWYTGAVTYQSGNFALLIFASLLILHYKRKFLFRSSVIHICISVSMLVITIGSNEISMLLCLSLLIILNVLAFLKKLKNKKTLFFFLLLTLTFSSLVFFAPGNHVREGYASEKHLFFKSLFYSLAQTARFTSQWILSLPLLGISVLYYFLHKNVLIKTELFSKSFFLTPLLSLFFLFFVVFISIFPAYWSMGILGQHRTINVAYFSFIVLWFINLSVFFNHFKNKVNKLAPLSPKAELLLIICIVLFLTWSRNSFTAISDLYSGRAEKFNNQMNDRLFMFVASQTGRWRIVRIDTVKGEPLPSA